MDVLVFRMLTYLQLKHASTCMTVRQHLLKYMKDHQQHLHTHIQVGCMCIWDLEMIHKTTTCHSNSEHVDTIRDNHFLLQPFGAAHARSVRFSLLIKYTDRVMFVHPYILRKCPSFNKSTERTGSDQAQSTVMLTQKQICRNNAAAHGLRFSWRNA